MIYNTLDTMKQILNITDTSKDTILNFYLTRSYNAIKNYLNYTDEEMENNFKIEIVDLAIFWYKNKDKTGTIQMSQGSRSLTLERGLPRHIKDSLPMPRIKVVG